MNNPDGRSLSPGGAITSHLNWKSCWQTSWAQKDAGEMTEQLNWWCYSQPGPVSPGSYNPRCSRGHVSLRGVWLIIPHTKHSHISRLLPRPRNFRNSIDSKSNSPVRDLSSAEVILSQSPSERDREIKPGQSESLKQIWAHYTWVSATQTRNAPSTVSSVWRTNPITHAMAYAIS